MADEATLFKELQRVTSRIHGTDNIDEIILELSNDICAVFDADRLTIYTVDEERNAIVAKAKKGLNEVRVLTLPMVPEYSVASYVAVHKRLVNIKDAYDDRELKSFDPPVTFLQQIDARVNYRTRQMLVAPILDPREADLLGVVQLINRVSKQPFTKLYEEAAVALCSTLAIAFRQRTLRKPKVRSKLDYLVVEGVLGTTQFDQATEAARNRGVSLEHYLRNELRVKDDALGRALAKYYHVPYEPFRADRAKPETLLAKLKRDFVEKAGWLPLEESDGALVVLALDPEAVRAKREVQAVLDRYRVEYRVCSGAEFARTVDQMYGTISGLRGVVDAPGDVVEAAPVEEVEETPANESEVSRVVNKIISDAFAQGASDIHLEPKPGKDGRIRFRKDGALAHYDVMPVRLHGSVVSRLKIMANLKIDERRVPQDGKIKFAPLGIELRIATLPTAGGVEDVVMRILAAGKPLPVEKLGLSSRNLAELKAAVSKPYGLFLVCGPTGSGKTTTLHSVLSFLNTEDTKIWTAEDPVEITQDGLRQVQINVQQKLTFDKAMRAFLRADPDVIMVGEMRDAETAGTGVEASLTGHLVLATLHTNSAPESIIRLLDLGLDPFNFADALLGILAQRLARRLCADCKKPHPAGADELKELIEEYCAELAATDAFARDPKAARKALYEDWVRAFGGGKALTLCERKGCERCGGSGYRGRVGLHELLIGTDAMKKDIQEKARVARMFATALNDGMRTLKQDGIEKVLQGLTDMDQVRAVCIK